MYCDGLLTITLCGCFFRSRQPPQCLNMHAVIAFVSLTTPTVTMNCGRTKKWRSHVCPALDTGLYWHQDFSLLNFVVNAWREWSRIKPVLFNKTTAMHNFGHEHTLAWVYRSTRPSTLCGMVKYDYRPYCWLIIQVMMDYVWPLAAYNQTQWLSLQLAYECGQPAGAGHIHSSDLSKLSQCFFHRW